MEVTSSKMPQIMDDIHSNKLQSTDKATESSNLEERDPQLKTVQNSLNIDDEKFESDVIATNNCIDANVHRKNNDLRTNAITTVETEEIKICTNAENEVQNVEKQDAAIGRDDVSLKENAEEHSSNEEHLESLVTCKNKEIIVNSNDTEDAVDKSSMEDGEEETGDEREDVEHLRSVKDDSGEQRNNAESVSLAAPTQYRNISRNLEVDLLLSDEEEEEELEGEEEEEEKQDTKLESDENSFQGIRIDVDDSGDSSKSDKEDSSDVEMNEVEGAGSCKKSDNASSDGEELRKSEEKQIFTISDEESAHSIRQSAVQNAERQEDEASHSSEEKSDEVINVDDDEEDVEDEDNDDDTQDEIGLNDSIAEKDLSEECTAACSENSRNVAGENDNKCGYDDQVPAMEICSSTSSDDVSPKDQDMELLNGGAENSVELKIDIDDNDAENHHAAHIDNKEDGDDIDASRNYDHQANEEPKHSSDKTAAQSGFISSDNLAESLSTEDSLIKTIRREFSRNEYHTEKPKLNGDHKMSDSDDQSNAVIDTQTHSPFSYNSIPLQNNDDDDSCGEEAAEESTNTAEYATTHHTSTHLIVSKSPTKQPDDGEDEVSRLSISSSASSSSTTSSLHQLVIDHPIEDGGGTTLNSQTESLPSLKLSLKRKLSSSSDTLASSPPHKRSHLELDSSASYAMIQEDEAQKFKSFNGELLELSSSCEVDEQKPCEVDSVLSESLVSEKPVEYSTPAAVPEMESISESISEVTKVPETATSQAVPKKGPEDLLTSKSPERNSPLLNSLLLKKRTRPVERVGDAVPSDVYKKNKYLCFNCKIGCFETLSSLIEHQNHCLAKNSLLPAVAMAPTHSTPLISPEQLSRKLDKLVDNSAPKNEVSETASEKKHYYKCSSCETFHENWHLFLHIREMHNRHMCLYCLRMFPTAEKLSLHLEIKHDLEQNHYNSEEALRQSVQLVQESIGETRFLMCCTCQHVFLEHENFSDHVCTEFMQACSMCGQKGRHTNQCKAQNESKRSKVKKKSKAKDFAPNPNLPEKSNASFVTPQSEAVPMLQQLLNCDKAPNVPSPPLHSAFQHSSPAFQSAPSFHHYNRQTEENNSCNMTVDETFNNTSSDISSVSRNPPSVLGERDCLGQQTNLSQPVLSPDRHQISDQVVERPEATQPLVVPKLKLRVPKEFQKSVDAAISSTESEDDDESPINEDDGDRMIDTSNLEGDNESATGSMMELQNSPGALTKQHTNIEDDDSLDEPNSSLVRILQEIERTKLDIKRTKETLYAKPLPATPRMASISQSSNRTGDHSWSPTPPASPHSQWFTPRRMISQSDGEIDVVSRKDLHAPQTIPPPFRQQFPHPPPFLPPPSPLQKERRNTTGSDVDMDIDETISGHTSQCNERSTQSEGNTTRNNDADKIAAETVLAKQNSSSSNSKESCTNIDVVNISNVGLEGAEKIKPPTHGDEEPMETEENVSRKETVAATEHRPTLPEMETTNLQRKSPTDKQQGTEPIKPPQSSPSDGIPIADEDIKAVDLQLNRPLEKFEVVEFVRICLKAVYPLCLYCNHARRIAVNGKSLVLHLIAQHRFTATVDSITAEELKPNTIVAKLKSYLPELEQQYFNSNNYCTYGDGAFTYYFNERIFECFQCRFVTSTHKELYLHNRKMHLRTAILCFMCRSNFFSFSEILCHVCPGEAHKVSVFDVKFRCCLCEVDNIPSPFRLMVHLRKQHSACDVCLEDCVDQGRLSSHVWKHKLHHVCYRCGIAYRNKMDITKHLFWKHGTESIICKRCVQKRWRHVYHFCIPPNNFVCDICHLCFSKATYLKVHKRIHSGDLRYPCSDENCQQKFISRRMLLKHAEEHQVLEDSPARGFAAGTTYEGAKEKIAEKQPEPCAGLEKEISKPVQEEETDDKPSLIDGAEKKTTETTSKPSTDNVNAETKKSKHKSAKSSVRKQRKKKKSKHSKESLEDLNLIEPNLSESDSCEDSENKSKSNGSLVPKVRLSSTSESEYEKDDQSSAKDKSSSAPTDNKVLHIWMNLLQAQGKDAAIKADEQSKEATDYNEDNYPTPRKLHVAQSDHDYCVMFKPEVPKPAMTQAVATQVSPQKRVTTKSPRRNASVRRSDGSSGSSSGGSSGSDSDSTCSCGSNCSCSSSSSTSSSSSSSSNDSGESSAASHTSRKRHRKKSERDRLRKKNASVSPMKKRHHEESEQHLKMKNAALFDEGTKKAQAPSPITPTLPKEALFSESDLETAESETDEEFYDEHPQKLATELLAQKRAQLMAQTRLSPSHNYDIVENSRPSTPSLPDEVACEKKVKLKKKKRERKSAGRSVVDSSNLFNKGTAPALDATQGSQGMQPLPVAAQQHVPMNTANMLLAPRVSEPSVSGLQLNAANLQACRIEPHYQGRMSEGSSSDLDGSLKRSKRARRPNKFYGYTSDDEHSFPGLGQPLIIGMRSIKPQPPPQLIWRKEDLPTPSKSMLNNHKIKTPRPPKTPNALNPTGGFFSPNPIGSAMMTKKKKRAKLGDKLGLNRKRHSEQLGIYEPPPIPPLKIRPTQIGFGSSIMPGVAAGTNHIPASQIYSSSKESEGDEEEPESTDSSSDDEGPQQLLNAAVATTSRAARVWNSPQFTGTISRAPQPNKSAFLLPSAPPAPPQATVFNHKIPPALLPNPDFATLQYFKANNIRYPIQPPSGARRPRDGESVYCYCRCPYDEVSEMIACDGENCLIEWFHFECVGIMVAPQGKWFCAECRPQYSGELYRGVSKA